MVLSILGSSLTKSQEDDDHKDSHNELPFSSQCTPTSSHEVQTDWLALSQTGINTIVQNKRQRAMTVSHSKQESSGRNDANH